MNDKMNSLMNFEVLTMTSREIAELCGKQPKNVMRDIRNMIDSIEQGSDLSFVCKSSTYIGENGQSYSQYELDKDTCLTLLLGYDAVARFKVVKRWQELEKSQDMVALPNFNNPVEAARAWANEVEQKQILQIENQKQNALLSEQAPKVEFHDAIEASETSIPIGVFSKLINIPGMGRNNLFAWFRDSGYIGKRGREHNVAKQAYVRQGLFEVIERTITKPSGEDMITYTTLITGKGQIYFEKKLREEFN